MTKINGSSPVSTCAKPQSTQGQATGALAWLRHRIDLENAAGFHIERLNLLWAPPELGIFTQIPAPVIL